MKNIFKVLAITFAALIGFSFFACGGVDDGTNGTGTAPAITTTSLPSGTVGTAYSQTLAATGDTPITWSVESGALPAGLDIAATGVISGTPTTADTFTFTVKAANATKSDTKQLSIVIAASGNGNNSINITINKTGNETGDNLTASPTTGEVGDVITLNYTLANTKKNNRLEFSGTNASIAEVDSAGTGTRTYTIAQADVSDGTVTINAVFTHSDKTLDKIAFEDTHNETKTYGTATFTKAITNTGTGTRAITYSSSDMTVATVDNSGIVTIKKVGSTLITATKAEDETYAQATARYELTIDPLQLTIANPTLTTTKQYDGNTTAAVTAGALNNKVGSDDVSVTAVANYNSANVAEANQITVVYTISGTHAANYIKPVNYTTSGTITAATIAVTDVTLNSTTGSLNVGSTGTLTATVAPSNATNKNVTWSTSNPAVATVSNGVVTAAAVGTANITVTTADGSKTATCSVTVSAAIVGDVYWTGEYYGSGARRRPSDGTFQSASYSQSLVIDDFKEAFDNFIFIGNNLITGTAGQPYTELYGKGYFASLNGPTSGNPSSITLSGIGYLFIISSKEIKGMTVGGLSMMTAFTLHNLDIDGKGYFLYRLTTPLSSESSYVISISY